MRDRGYLYVEERLLSFTTSIFSAFAIPVGSGAHALVIDLLVAAGGLRNEKILTLRLNGATQGDIAHSMGMLQQSVSRVLAAIYRRAMVFDEDVPPRVGYRLRSAAGMPDAAEIRLPRPPGLRTARHGSHTSTRNRCWCLGRTA